MLRIIINVIKIVIYLSEYGYKIKEGGVWNLLFVW